jgi:hypothetical protein
MAGRFTPVSPGSAIFASIGQMLRDQENQRRQSSLDGIEVQSKLAAIQRAEAAAKRQAELDRQDAEDRQRRMAREDAAESEAANTRGMNTMTADALTMPGIDDPNQRRQLAAQFVREGREIPAFLRDAFDPPDAPRRQVVETVDANGRPVRRSVSEDDLIAGVPVYQQPREPRNESRRWVMRSGQPMFVTEGEIRPGDRPYENAGGNGNDKPPTQSQLTADTFHNRAVDALDAIDEVEDGIGAWDLVAPNFAQTGAGQQYHQAKKQFIEAYLRKDSGAAIGKDEYANADRTYFPQVGDSAATRRRKRAARVKIAESLAQQGSNQGGNTGGNAGGRRVRRYNPATGRVE